MESLDDLLLGIAEQMDKAVEFIHQQFAGLRTGKASSSMVEHLQVSYYGSAVRLREIANISTPDVRLIVINAYDPTALPSIEKAIMAANLGITPLNDGRVIKVPIPELSEERRRELGKVARQMTEKGRVSIRSIRQDANGKIKLLSRESKISEDEKEKGLREIQNLTDNCIKKLNEALARKEREIMTV